MKIFLFMCLAVLSAQAQMPPKKKLALKNDIEMAYVELGPTTGLPIVLLHGFTDTGRSFQLMAPELIRLYASARLIIPDLRGHGASSMPPPDVCAAQPERCFSMELMAQDVWLLLDELGVRSAWVVGHSMGSMVAQHMVAQQPARVQGAVLIATFVNGGEAGIVKWLKDDLIEGEWKNKLMTPSMKWPHEVYHTKPEDIGNEVVQFLRGNWVNEFQVPATFLDEVLPETVRTPLGTWIGAIRAMAQTDTRDRWKNWRTPTLILWPIQDMAFPETDQVAVRETFAQAGRANQVPIFYKTYGAVPLSGNVPTDFGHNLHWAAPRQTAEDIVSFITTGKPAEGAPYLDPKRDFEIAVDRSRNASVLLK